MTTSEKMLELIVGGMRDDTTIGAALDALREDRDFNHLDAVLAVAAAWKAGISAKQLVQATTLLAEGSPHRVNLLSSILNATCIPHGYSADVVVIDGLDWPRWSDVSISSPAGTALMASVVVGAEWVLRAHQVCVEWSRPIPRPNARRRRAR